MTRATFKRARQGVVLLMLLATLLPFADGRRLVERVARGDERALKGLYDLYAGKVLATARRLLGNLGEAEEVVQDTFIDVWNRAASFDAARGSAASWILTIGRNRAIDRLRTRASLQRAVTDMSRGEPATPSPTPPDRQVEHAQDRSRIARALQQLSPEQRAVVELAYFDGLSQSEIAARTGHPLGTIKGRARAALEKLAESLSEEVA